MNDDFAVLGRHRTRDLPCPVQVLMRENDDAYGHVSRRPRSSFLKTLNPSLPVVSNLDTWPTFLSKAASLVRCAHYMRDTPG